MAHIHTLMVVGVGKIIRLFVSISNTLISSISILNRMRNLFPSLPTWGDLFAFLSTKTNDALKHFKKSTMLLSLNYFIFNVDPKVYRQNSTRLFRKLQSIFSRISLPIKRAFENILVIRETHFWNANRCSQITCHSSKRFVTGQCVLNDLHLL